jgi:hypothetical protein
LSVWKKAADLPTYSKEENAPGVHRPRQVTCSSLAASGMGRELVRGLNRTTLGGLVVDEDRSPYVELLVHLADFRGQRDFLSAVVSPFAGHERFDDPAQGVRTQQAVGNDHGSAASALRDEGSGIGVDAAGFSAYSIRQSLCSRQVPALYRLLKTDKTLGTETAVVGDVDAFIDYVECGQALQDWNERIGMRLKELDELLPGPLTRRPDFRSR